MQPLELCRSRIPGTWDVLRNQSYIPAAILAPWGPSQLSRSYSTGLVAGTRVAESPEEKQLSISKATRSLFLNCRIGRIPKAARWTGAKVHIRRNSNSQVSKIIPDFANDFVWADERTRLDKLSETLEAYHSSNGTGENGRTTNLSSRRHDPWPDKRIDIDSLGKTLEAHRSWNRIQKVDKRRQKEVRHRKSSSARVSAGTETPNRVIEYEGRVLKPRGEWELSQSGTHDSLERPWTLHPDQAVINSEDAHTRLTDEILAYSTYMDSTAAEEKAAIQAFEDIREVIFSSDEEVKAVELIGSRSTGLAMPLSDLDVNITFEGAHNMELSKQRQIVKLQQIYTRINSPELRQMYAVTNLIKAKTPILETQHFATGLKIQVQSTLNAHATRDLTKAYLSEFPTLRPLFRLLRQTLNMRGLGQGGLGITSYPLTMMIVATLKFSGARFDRADIGRQLIYFLDFFTTIDLESMAISVDPPELFKKRTGSSSTPSENTERAKDLGLVVAPSGTSAEENPLIMAGRKRISQVKPERPYLMCLQDPANPVNDLGHNSIAIKHIQATFAALKKELEESMNIFSSDRAPEAQVYLLDPFILGDYSRLEAGRRKLDPTRQTHGDGASEGPQMIAYLSTRLPFRKFHM